MGTSKKSASLRGAALDAANFGELSVTFFEGTSRFVHQPLLGSNQELVNRKPGVSGRDGIWPPRGRI